MRQWLSALSFHGLEGSDQHGSETRGHIVLSIQRDPGNRQIAVYAPLVQQGRLAGTGRCMDENDRRRHLPDQALPWDKLARQGRGHDLGEGKQRVNLFLLPRPGV